LQTVETVGSIEYCRATTKIKDTKIPTDRQLGKRDFCDSCHEVANKLVKYQIEDKEQKITRLERYCLKYFQLIIILIREHLGN
jgi:hypothetical protein